MTNDAYVINGAVYTHKFEATFGSGDNFQIRDGDSFAGTIYGPNSSSNLDVGTVYTFASNGGNITSPATGGYYAAYFNYSTLKFTFATATAPAPAPLAAGNIYLVDNTATAPSNIRYNEFTASPITHNGEAYTHSLAIFSGFADYEWTIMYIDGPTGTTSPTLILKPANNAASGLVPSEILVTTGDGSIYSSATSGSIYFNTYTGRAARN